MLEKVSIIVPVYNVKSYINKCIQSLIDQDYENIEIIIVDDGSTDGCSLICDRFANENRKIKVIHQDNQGLSGARNTGMEAATGRYIAFVDSDDWVTDDYISHQMKLAMNYNADIVVMKQLSVWDGIELVDTADLKEKIYEYNKTDAMEALLYGYDIQCSACKLFKAELIRKYPFPIGALYEDLGMMYKVFGDANKVVRSNIPMYFYRRRAGSIINEEFNERHLVIIEHANRQYEYIKSNFPELIKAASYRCAYVVTEIAPMVIAAGEFDTFKKIRRELMAHWKDLLLNKKANKKIIIRGLAILCGEYITGFEVKIEKVLKTRMKKVVFKYQ